MKKEVTSLSVATFAMLSVCAADVSNVLVRQLWPWSTDVQVEYRLTGVSSAAPVDLSVSVSTGGRQVTVPAGAIRGRLYAISESGAGSFFIDPIAIFGSTRVAVGDFRVSVSAVASDAAMTVPIYRILDLETGATTDLCKADFLNGEAGDRADVLCGDVGRFETDFGKVGEGFNTTLSDVLVWTGVTNNIAYKHNKMVFRRIPAAGVRWLEGSDPDQPFRLHPTAETQRYCTLSKSYWMAIYETTREQMRIMRGMSTLPLGEDFNVKDQDLLKVQPSQYTAWTSLTNSLIPSFATKYSCPMTLPTEAQWEFACRAGTTTGVNNGKELTAASSRSESLDEVAWYSNHRAPLPEGASSGMHSEVGKLKPNAYGLYDMHGNVAEFVLDRRKVTAARDSTEVFDPLIQDDTQLVVICGGQTAGGPSICTSAARDEHSATSGTRSGGFRLIIPIN